MEEQRHVNSQSFILFILFANTRPVQNFFLFNVRKIPMFKSLFQLSCNTPSGTGRCSKVSPEPSLLGWTTWTLPASMAEVFHPSEHLCGFLGICSNSSVSFLCWEPRAGCSPAGGVSAEQNPLPPLLPTELWVQPRTRLPFWAARLHGWVMLILISTLIAAQLRSSRERQQETRKLYALFFLLYSLQLLNYNREFLALPK